MKIKALFPDHTISFVSVKKVLSRLYLPTTRVKVTFIKTGITLEMDLAMYYTTVDELTKVNDAFGILNDDRYMLIDSETLSYTHASNSATKCEIWKQDRKAHVYTANAEITEEGEQNQRRIKTN
jgi:hypothetical protein